MANGNVSTQHPQAFVIDAETVTRTRHLLLDAIKSVAALESLVKNVQAAAASNYPASVIIKAGMLNAGSDLDVGDAADMVLALELLPPTESFTGGA